MVHRLHHFDRTSDRALCDACGWVEIHWKSKGKDRPRVGVCKVAHELDKKLQRLKGSDTEYARDEINRIRLKQQYFIDQKQERESR